MTSVTLGRLLASAESFVSISKVKQSLPARRNALVEIVAQAVGATAIRIESAHAGWPSKTIVFTDTGPVRVALHVGPVGLSQRDRDLVERRFQNPGSDRAVKALDGSLPILLGIWNEEGRTVLFGLDGKSRVGRTTRFSLFVPLELLQTAANVGWSERLSTSGEKLTAFHPALLPVFVQLVQAEIAIDARAVSAIVSASGMADDAGGAAQERGRRTASTLVREALFSRDVRNAYAGACAMCGITHSLVVGAHIYPVSAPGSQDRPWNGIALCHHHHALFDSHRVWVDPTSRRLVLHPSLRNEARNNVAGESLVRDTYAQLSDPSAIAERPRSEMFSKRYEYFAPKYRWTS